MKNNKIEQALLAGSGVLTIILGIIGLLIGLHIDSTAISVDGIYSLTCALSSIFCFIVNKKIHSQSTPNFQFGYFKFEPMVITLQGAMILITCVFALISAARDLIHVHAVKNFAIPAVFQTIVALCCFLMAYLLCKQGRRTRNGILLSQGLTWFIDAFQSLFISSAFFLDLIVKNTAYAFIVPYVDPALVFFLVVVIIREPLQLLKINCEDLLDRVPNDQVNQRIDTIISETLKKIDHSKIDYKIIKRKAGSAIFVYIFVSPDTKLSIQSLHAIKTLLIQNLSKEIQNINLGIGL